MTQENKELLLKDLCARLPFNVKADYDSYLYYINEINSACKHINYVSLLVQDEKRQSCAKHIQIEDIKPYLRPLSSMTEEESRTYMNYFRRMINNQAFVNLNKVEEYMDWLNSHHFDYRNLIEKGLALEAPSDMYNLNKE